MLVDPSVPTRLRSGMRPDTDIVNYTANGALPQYSTKRPTAGWAAFSEKRRHAPSWLAGWAPAVDEKPWRALSASSLDLSPLWRLFHFFEAPRRRVLTAPAASAAPSTLRFCLLCALWYMSSAMSSNTGKAILNQFRFPITLTIVQFGFVAGFCLLFASPAVRFTRLRPPTRAILHSTFPMGLFQVGGHMFSSMAISRIPVSTVHTIKALSPLFTVAAYALCFGVKYSPKTYISLLPLTVGVMLACSFDMSASNALGLLCAFGSAIVFVSSNIFFKKVMPSQRSGGGPSQAPAHKLDKLNLLFYSSSMAFLLMVPIWLYYDLPALWSRPVYSPSTQGKAASHGVLYYFIMNGTVHFGQNIIAFVILASTSPVTYSIASLFKRVAVICIAILWFSQSVHPVQAVGICMTFGGLWMYNKAKGDVEKGENKMRRVEAAKEMILPSTRTELRAMDPSASPAISDEEELRDDATVSLSSAVGRPVYAPPNNAHVHHLSHPPQHSPHSHTHNPLNLHIEVSPPKAKSHTRTGSHIDSYPSPPPSLDSPPPSTKVLSSPTPTITHAPSRPTNRRGTLSRMSRELSGVSAASPIYVTA